MKDILATHTVYQSVSLLGTYCNCHLTWHPLLPPKLFPASSEAKPSQEQAGKFVIEESFSLFGTVKEGNFVIDV
jgi:hypothetical protein